MAYLIVNGRRYNLNDRYPDSLNVGVQPLPWRSGEFYAPMAHVYLGQEEYVNVTGKRFQSQNLTAEYNAGKWAYVRTLARGELPAPSGQVSALLQFVEDREYTVILDQKFEGTLEEVSHRTLTGTCDIDVRINGVGVTGLTGLSVDANKTTSTATGSKGLSMGDEVSVVISNSIVVEDLQLTFKLLPQ